MRTAAGASGRAVIAVAIALALVSQGCSSSYQVVRFDSRTKPVVRVTRSIFARGPSSGTVPFQSQVRRGRVYRVRLKFDDAALRAIGYGDPEIVRLRESGTVKLTGGLVCPELPKGANRTEPAMLLLNTAELRGAWDGGKEFRASAHDDAGNLRALLKVSPSGVSLDDPDLTAHGTPVSTSLVVAGDVVVVTAAIATVVGLVVVGSAIALQEVVDSID